MPDRARTFALPILVVLAVLAIAHVTQSRSITPAERAATFRFEATSDFDRNVVLGAVAHARPEARRLLDAVDGLTTIAVGPTPPHSVGVTVPMGDRYVVLLNLGAAARASAQRGMERLVLHELGHVIDMALVPDDVVARLDAQVPTRYGCNDGVTGACTNNAEVFAESFAKWATGDIGVDLYAGYKVPPPGPSLEAWGAPLAQLGR
jgi:hypothetical protein